MRRLAAAVAFLALAGCERAGADLENATGQPVTVVDALQGRAAPLTYIVEPRQTMQSVWYVGEHRYYEFRWPAGNVIRLQGEDLKNLAERCPKHCILRITHSGVMVVRTNIFGQPKD